MIEEHSARRLVSSLALLCGLFAGGAVASENNLQVLPLHLDRPEILEVMRLMTVGLGAQCETCHATGQNDFQSDELAAKQLARDMMRMVQASRPGLDWTQPPQDLCSKCHEGALTPRGAGEFAGSFCR